MDGYGDRLAGEGGGEVRERGILAKRRTDDGNKMKTKFYA